MSPKTAPSKKSSGQSSGKDFEKSLAELEKIVERMEDGEQSLDACLKDFERGMLLSRACAESLKDAEQRVEIVVKKHKGFEIEDFGDANSAHGDNENEDDPEEYEPGKNE